MQSKCPMCGTPGSIWNRNPDVFRCPNCLAIFSEFGLVLESELEYQNLWS
jgi:rubrerythrin